MKQVYAYIRVSTVKQGEKGSSLHEQRDAIKTFAARHELSILAWFEEMETAAASGRKQFSRLLALLRKGKADGVIFHKIDRGARNLTDWAHLCELSDHGTAVYSVSENVDLQSTHGRLSADIQAAVAASYIRNLRDEVRKGLYGRLKQGVYPFPAPMGYLDRGGGAIKEVDPIMGPLVRKGFELYATGRYTLIELSQELERLGLRTKTGGLPHKARLSTMLNNPFYVGLIHIKRNGETFQGAHQPLISLPLFDRVQGVLSGKRVAMKVKHPFLFRRLVKCRLCGYTMIGEIQKGIIYYRCHTPSCPTTGIREDAIESAALDALRKVCFTADELSELSDLVTELKEDWGRHREDHRRSLQLNLNQIVDRLKRLTDAYIDRMIDKAAFDERNSALLRERASLREQTTTLDALRQSVPERIEKFLELAKSIADSYVLGLSEEKREILESATSNFIAERKNISVELRSPYCEIANRSSVSLGAPRRPRPRTALRALIKKLEKYFSTLYDDKPKTREADELDESENANDQRLDQAA